MPAKKIAEASWKGLAAHTAVGAAVGGALGYLDHPEKTKAARRKRLKAAVAGALTGGIEHVSHDYIDSHYKESALGNQFQRLVEGPELGSGDKVLFFSKYTNKWEDATVSNIAPDGFADLTLPDGGTAEAPLDKLVKVDRGPIHLEAKKRATTFQEFVEGKAQAIPQNRIQEAIDPPREEMVNFLKKAFGDSEEDEVDREEAIHWFAADYHGGQGSSLYSALSTSEFRPGMMALLPRENGLAGEMYRALEAEYGR